MRTKTEIYFPQIFRTFQGFDVIDLKEWHQSKRIEVILESKADRKHLCFRCGSEMGASKERYYVRARHLRVMGYQVMVCFWRERRHCPKCKKFRSEVIDFICPESPHVTKELAWWITKLTSETSVLATSRLESIDKKTCYEIDKYILRRLLQGYEIPKVTHISADEVYARGPTQQKEGETRDDLFFTVIVDLKRRRVIWVSKSRRKEALDEFFTLYGEEGCKGIRVVCTDQHEGYAASVKAHCPRARLIWDKFHIMKNFEEAVNKVRMKLHDEMAKGSELKRLSRGQFRFIFLKRASERTKAETDHIDSVVKLNHEFERLELIKERMLTFWNETSYRNARKVWEEIGDWIWQAGFGHLMDWYRNLEQGWHTLKRYFAYRVTTAVSEGINRVIKGLKWQAYGYKDMEYFKLKILQKAGYLNYRFACLDPEKW